MINTCKPTPTLRDKSWEYQQYYVGEKDKDDRRSGNGENNWSGAKSLEWYSGRFIRNTMHGMGDYHWRYLGPENLFVSYEGYFYCNRLHGYGVMSYSDGRTFQGLFCNNVRWGPGVECHAKVHQDVGIWRGTQLVRLTWRPDPPSIAPDFLTSVIGRTTVESYRTLLTTKVETVGEVNYALELLKQSGADPRVAVDKWIKLYPKQCTDLASPLCQTDVFDRDYYNGKIYTLQEVKEISEHKLSEQIEDDNISQEVGTFYAWNNSKVLLNIMKHSYRHEKQRKITRINLKTILSGPRNDFKPAGDHELHCRSLLMASYLGYVADVAELINENNIHPDIADLQGNSAIMYATSGDQAEVIHFLVEAGANIDLYNDCCCTPLGIALMRYTCTYKDIPPSGMVQALLPPPVTPITVPMLIAAAMEPTISEWKINRELSYLSLGGTLTKSPSKIGRNISSKKIKSLLSIKEQPMSKRRIDPGPLRVFETVYDSEESLTDEKKSYNSIHREYCIKITDVFTTPINPTLIPYIFDIIDMAKEIDASEEEQKKPQDKNPKKVTSKIMKDAIKTSKDLMWQNNEAQSINSAEKLKTDTLSRIKQTIQQLLSDGANPKLIQCPQPALLIAIMSNSSDLLRDLVRCGADINETYPRVLNYTPLDVAISRPYNTDNLEIVHTLLACGADTLHRLIYEAKDPVIPELLIPGPTLLHAVLARKVENVAEEDVSRSLLELLLQYDCDPLAQFKGSSAIDVAMNNHFELLDIFIKSPKTNLNAKINDRNQSILVKMFSNTFFRSVGGCNRLQTFTNLLLFGADPLIECRNGEDIYPNIFVFAKKTLNEMEFTQGKPNSPQGSKPDSKIKKPEKPKKDEKLSTKSMGKMMVDDVEDYRQAIDQVTDCARVIYIRWLQARLVKELTQVIYRYKHRQWNMILKELGDTKSYGLWLTPQRCLEIWNLLSSTKKKMYNDQRVLRYLLCIAIFMSWNNFGTLKSSDMSNQKLTAIIKGAIETDVTRIIRQNNKNKELPEIEIWKLSYVKPELTKDISKFNICFECALPLEPDKIVCCWCNLISFCSYECLKININRVNGHPCSDFLKLKYFPTSDNSVLKIL